MPEKQGDIDEVGLLTRAKKTYILLFDRVLKEWLRVTSLGGIIAFTHKVFPLKKPLVAIRLPLAMPFLPRLIFVEGHHHHHRHHHLRFPELGARRLGERAKGIGRTKTLEAHIQVGQF